MVRSITFNGLRPLAEMDRLFGRVVGSGVSWTWPVSIWEEGEHAFIELDLPGVNKDDVQITIDNGQLVVAAERKSPPEERQYWRDERHYGRFERTFELPDTYDTAGVTADFTSGVLKLTLSKKPE